MKRLFFAFVLLGFATIARATVTIDFQVGVLANSDGSVPIADGMLVQLIAAPTTGGFMAPTPTTFISGSEIMLWTGAFDSSTTGFNGVMDIAPAPISISTLPAGWALMVQWFPTLGSAAGAPGNSTAYGQYSTINDGTWVSPADAAVVTFTFLTLSGTGGNGTSADSLGFATSTTAPIPEPSTYAAILGAMALGFVAYRRRMCAAA
jgi:hypothetical protein